MLSIQASLQHLIELQIASYYSNIAINPNATSPMIPKKIPICTNVDVLLVS